jgi:large subunit ribosomal protein L17
MANRKLGRTSGHRAALFRNQLASMIEHERIVTTLIKAKELRPIVEKMVTLGKNDSVHNRRQAARSIHDDTLVAKLFTDISSRMASRPGGYTRIVKLGPRRGDGAEMAILEFVDFKGIGTPAPAEKKTTAKKSAKPAAPKSEEPGEETEKKPAAPKKKAAAPKKEAAPKKSAPAKKAPAKKTAAKKKTEK